jgi:hypothetical protein
VLLLTFVINTLLVSIAVMTHYEILSVLSNYIPKAPITRRARVLLALFGAMLAHIFEIWLFAFAYFALIWTGKFGSLLGNFGGSLLDCSYFSFTTYTSLGFGDIAPSGNIRFLAALEALTGLVLITWTASFLYIEMQRFWDQRR